MLSRLAHWCFRRHWLTIIIWLVALFGGSTIANGVIGGGAFETRFSIPNTESLRALNLLQDAFPDSDTITDAQIVFQVASDTPDGVNNADVQSIMTEVFTKIVAGVEGLTITSPYDNPRLVSASQPIAYAIMKLPDGDSQDEQQKIGAEIRAIAEPILIERNALNVVDVELRAEELAAHRHHGCLSAYVRDVRTRVTVSHLDKVLPVNAFL